jgi:hypothetical protein
MGNMPQTLSPAISPDKPKLLEQVRNVIRRKHFSVRTEQAYTDWKERPIGRFAHVNRTRFFRPQMRDLVIFVIEKTQRQKRWAIVICRFDEV